MLLVSIIALTTVQTVFGINSVKISSVLAFVSPLAMALVFESIFYYKVISEKTFVRTFVCFFIFTVFLFVFYKTSSSYLMVGGALGGIYFIVFLLPIVFLLKNDIFKYLALLITLILAVLSFKRGAIIAVAIIFVGFIITGIRGGGFKRLLVNLILLTLFAFVIFYYYSHGGSDLEHALERISRMKEDGGSGRDEIFMFFLDRIRNFDIGEHFLGLGAKATALYETGGLTSHNDWIEIYFDFGALPFCIWLTFILKEFYNCLVFYKKGVVTMLLPLLLAYVVVSMVSHVMIYSYFAVVLIYIEYLKSKSNENRNTYLS